MRPVPFIASALLSLAFASCSITQTPPAKDGEANASAESSTGVPDKKEEGEQGGSASAPVTSHGSGAAKSMGILSLPSAMRDPSADPDDYILTSGPLPGEMPNGLRTPTLPDVLPLTLDGKINPAAATPAPAKTF